MGQKELHPQINFRVIEITPTKMKYSSVREGVFNITWEK